MTQEESDQIVLTIEKSSDTIMTIIKQFTKEELGNKLSNFSGLALIASIEDQVRQIKNNIYKFASDYKEQPCNTPPEQSP